MRARKYKDLTGQQFGRWQVLGHLGTDKHNDRLWQCRCECGLEKPVKAMYLLAGSSRQCVKCGQQPKPYAEGIPDAVWNHTVKMAERRKIPMLMTKDEAFALLVQQDRRCALSGVTLTLPENGTETQYRQYTASLDRIDSAGPYAKDNVQWVHKQINIMKNVFTQEEFVVMCVHVATKCKRIDNHKEYR